MFKKLALIMVIALSVASCNNWAARYGGGQVNVDVPAGQKVINATWKDDSLWVLTTKRAPEEAAKVYEFKEFSRAGILEGKVILVER